MNATWKSTAATALFGLALFGSGSVALAQSSTKLGTYRDWSVHTYSDQRGKVCYAATQPTGSEPKGVNRDPIFFMLTSRPAEKVKNEPSVIIGYPLKEDSKVTVDVDGKVFTMFTKDDGAWLENPADEPALVAAMRNGKKMTVKGTSRRGTNTTDTFSLLGISAALDASAKACP